MLTKATVLLFISTLFIFIGCNQKASLNKDDYMAWLDDLDNDIAIEKSVNGLKVKVKYIPTEYLVYQSLENNERINKPLRDSLIKLRESNLSFLMTIGPDKETESKGDVMYRGLQKYKDYVERSMTMNFDMQEYISLVTEDGEYRSVLSNMENVYSLKESRTMIIVFSPKISKGDLSEAESYDFIYSDQLFELGILHFRFKKEDFNNIPEIKFW